MTACKSPTPKNAPIPEQDAIVKRYDLEAEDCMGGWASRDVMNEREHGDWVLYEDAAARIAELEAAIAELKAEIADLVHPHDLAARQT